MTGVAPDQDTHAKRDAAAPTRWTRWRRAAASAPGRRAFWVALMIGTVLNLINQGDALLAHHSVHWVKMALTYMVPFFVSLHGAISANSDQPM